MALFENYTFTLTTVSPLRVGSGEKLDRKQYYMTGDGKTILMLDQRKLIDLLVRKGKLDDYTDQIQQGVTLEQFFQQNSRVFSPGEIEQAALYSLPVSNQLEGRYLHLFRKDCGGQPYIPGSSLKGAIITALFAVYYEEIFVKQYRDDYEEAIWRLVRSYRQDGRAEFTEQQWGRLDRALLRAMKILVPDLSDKNASPEQKRVINLLRAIRISDSEPVDRSRLAACCKADAYIEPRRSRYGAQMNENNPGILHESLIPGTEVRFRLSIDCGCLARFREGMTAAQCVEWIRDALNTFREQQDFYFTDLFFAEDKRDTSAPQRDRVLADCVECGRDHFYFGAGTGFVNKTLVYPILAAKAGNDVLDRAIGFIAGLLDKQFSSSKHSDDVDLQVSPHKLKCVYYNDQRYLMGHCLFAIEPERAARKLR